MSVDINISNYEEYLLSYIDGELNDEEGAALAAFLQQHPEQAKELELLKATVLQPDKSLVFGNREELYHSTLITTENYETFFLSYIDGELNAAEQAALEAFLEKHPHLQQELDTWQATRLPNSEGPRFEHKEMLYRHADALTPENYETYLLSYIDGELSATEVETLHAFLQEHSELQATLQLFGRTRLKADLQLRMPGKAALYRNRGRRIQPAWWWGAAAAVLAGCLVWLLPLQRDGVNTAPATVATTTNNTPSADRAQQMQKASPDKPNIRVTLDEQQVRQAPGLVARNTAVTPAAEQPAQRNIRPVKEKALQPAMAASQPALNANTGLNSNNNNATVLAQLPQPRATSEEVVQQHIEKTVQAATPPIQEVAAAHTEPDPVLASTVKLQHTPAPEAQPAAAPVQGELIMSVTSSSESKLLNGVASVAKFFSKKKRHKSE